MRHITLEQGNLLWWLGDFGRLAIATRPRPVNGLTLLYDPEPINNMADRINAHGERLYEVFDQGDA